jgi:hypothetical protein
MFNHKVSETQQGFYIDRSPAQSSCYTPIFRGEEIASHKSVLKDFARYREVIALIKKEDPDGGHRIFDICGHKYPLDKALEILDYLTPYHEGEIKKLKTSGGFADLANYLLESDRSVTITF